MRIGPSGVSTLSGWNCTPSIGNDLWRTPMISPCGGARGYFEHGGDAIRLGNQRVIAARLEILAPCRHTVLCRHAATGDTLPCIRRAARTTLPPNTSTRD